MNVLLPWEVHCSFTIHVQCSTSIPWHTEGDMQKIHACTWHESLKYDQQENKYSWIFSWGPPVGYSSLYINEQAHDRDRVNVQHGRWQRAGRDPQRESGDIVTMMYSSPLSTPHLLYMSERERERGSNGCVVIEHSTHAHVMYALQIALDRKCIVRAADLLL